MQVLRMLINGRVRNVQIQWFIPNFCRCVVRKLFDRRNVTIAILDWQHYLLHIVTKYNSVSLLKNPFLLLFACFYMSLSNFSRCKKKIGDVQNACYFYTFDSYARLACPLQKTLGDWFLSLACFYCIFVAKYVLS